MAAYSEGPEAESFIETCIGSMALEAKARLLSGADSFSLHSDESIGLERLVLSDGPTGVRGPVVVGGRVGCLLPNASLLAQSWNLAALREVGDLLAEEAVAQRTHVVLGPTINLHRSPLGGRLFEAFSEDPLLTGRLAAAYVQGLQDRGVAATPKHFLGNESETERTTVNAVIGDTGLREAYLLPFEIVLQDAQPWALMAAYNRINGLPSTEQDPLMNGVVKGEWAYDGLIMSDWLATQTAAESANAGLDLVMPGPETPWTVSLVRSVRAGLVREGVVDDHVRRLLRLAARVGAFHTVRTWEQRLPKPASVYRREQLTRLAAEGMVVIKNESAILPLQTSQKIALIGRHALDTIPQGGGSAQVRPPHVVSIADGLSRRVDAGSLTVFDGVETRATLPPADTAHLRDPENGKLGIRIRVFDASGTLTATRHSDLAEIEDSQDGWLEGAERIEFEAVVELPEATTVRLGARGPGEWTISVPGSDEQFEITYHEGPGGGFFRPKSHTTTVMLAPGDLVRASVRRGELPRILGLVLSTAPRPAAATIAGAVRVAQAADTSVVVVGFTPDQETEGLDKTTLALPGDQDALVAAVATAANKTIVVVNSATPILMPWLDLVDAVLFAGLPGQEAGDAVAAALTGEYLPEGRLVTTFPAHDGEGPSWNVTPRHGDLDYAEGSSVGYRGWYGATTPPAFWFGHGLGYAEWDYESAELVSSAGQEGYRVRVSVRNTGTHPGRETVQVYARPHSESDPIRLAGWSQIALSPGERATVDVRCDPRVLRRWVREHDRWAPLEGLDLIVARGLGDVRATIPVSA